VYGVVFAMFALVDTDEVSEAAKATVEVANENTLMLKSSSTLNSVM